MVRPLNRASARKALELAGYAAGARWRMRALAAAVQQLSPQPSGAAHAALTRLAAAPVLRQRVRLIGVAASNSLSETAGARDASIAAQGGEPGISDRVIWSRAEWLEVGCSGSQRYA